MKEIEIIGENDVAKYRFDEKLYNDLYHSVEPRFFSPFDLWKGKYDK